MRVVGIWSCLREGQIRRGLISHSCFGRLGEVYQTRDLVLIKANEFIAEEASSKDNPSGLVLAAAKAARRAGAGRLVVGELNDNTLPISPLSRDS